MIVFIILAFVISIIAIILVSVAYSQKPTSNSSSKAVRTKPATSASSSAPTTTTSLLPIASGPPPSPPTVKSLSPRKIIKTPSVKRQMKTTPKDPSGYLDKLYVIDENNIKHRLIPKTTEPVIDIAYFNEGLLVLLNYGNLIFLKREKIDLIEYQLPGTVVIISIEAFNDCIIGLGQDGRLYQFNFENEDNYEWVPFFSSLKNVIYINAPTTQCLLFVQTATHSYVLDESYDIIEKYESTPNLLRVYGNSVNQYAIINRSELTVQFSDTSISIKQDVYDGAWHNDKFVTVSYDHYIQGIQKIKTIDDQLYYIITS